MKKEEIEKQLALAKTICEQLRRNEYDAFLELLQCLDPVFRGYAYTRVFEGVSANEVVNDFWMKLRNGKAICAYEGRTGASLRTYLIGILHFRIIDANRSHQSKFGSEILLSPEIVGDIIERKDITKTFLDRSSDNEIQENKRRPGDQVPQEKNFRPERALTEFIKLPKSPEDLAVKGQVQDLQAEIILSAVERLARIRPKDAQLIWFRMQGLSYEEIARRFGAIGEKEIKKKTNALKKQFTRAGTGSSARFGIILERVIKDKGFALKDLLDD